MKTLLFIPALLVLAFLILLRASAQEEKPLRLNRNNRHWGRSNHGDHGASRGKAITTVIPVFPVPPWLNLQRFRPGCSGTVNELIADD